MIKIILKLMILSFIMIIFAIDCSKDNDSSINFKLVAPDQIDSLEYKIYEARFQDFSFDTFIIAQQTLISRPKIIDIFCKSLSETKYYNNFDTTIVTDFKQKNSSAYNLDINVLKIGDKKIIILSQKELDFYFNSSNKDKAWDKYFNKYSRCYYSYSRVGYNLPKNQAIMEFIVNNNSDSIPTSVVDYFRIENGKWKKVYSVVETFGKK